jgi:uncharacterized membrane protein YbhN (UPF0104 family)
MVGLIVSGIVIAMALPRFLRMLDQSRWLRGRMTINFAFPSSGTVVRTMLAYGACYFMLGAGLWLIATAVSTSGAPSYFHLTGSFALAWLLGFIAPGVPAGLGAREGMMLIFLEGTAPPDVVLAIIVASRVASIFGDLICFAIGLVIFPGLRAKIPT